MHEYTFGRFALEFTPASGTKGYLATTAGETTYGAQLNIATATAREKYFEAAQKLYSEDFTEEARLEFLLAITELSTTVVDAINVAAAKASSAEDDEDPGDVVAENAPEEGSERHATATELLQKDDIFEEAAKTMRTLGHVGEWSNKKLAFVCAVSARAESPVQPSTHAASAAGKNYLWDTVLKLVPPELVYRRTGLTAKALFRTKMSLKHSILYIQELAGSEGADFSIRTLQSDGVLKWEATEKNAEGSFVNVEYEVEGPCTIVQTTTRNHLHPENETRVIPLYLDESPEQTKRINAVVKKRAAGKGAISATRERALTEKWHDALRLLEPAEIVIPYAERIEVPDQPLRLRRDFPRLLSIIRLVAWVHQKSRKRDVEDRILATEEDFGRAISMVGDSFARAWKSLSPSEEKVYDAITEHVPANLQKNGFKRSHVDAALAKTKTELATRTVKNALYGLASNGFLDSDYRRGVAGTTYTVAKVASSVKNISLAPDAHLPINEKSGESGIGKANVMGNSESAHSCPLPINDAAGEEGMGKGHERAKRDLPIKDGLGMPKSTGFGGNGQMGMGSAEEKNLEGKAGWYEYSEDE